MTADDTQKLLLEGIPEVPSKRIVIDFIDHSEQIYETPGNYTENENEVHIYVSKTRPHYDILVALHEFLEVYLVRSCGMPMNQIDDFDIAFEKMREEYPDIVGEEEPGNSSRCPYYDFHQIATRVEKWFCETLRCDFNQYDKVINELHK